MRAAFLVYGVVYVVIEMTAAALEDVGWVRVTALDVATAVANACLAIALVLASLLALKLGGQRWGGTVRGWWDALGHPDVVWDDIGWDDEPLGVRSWRPPAHEATPASGESGSSGGTYAGNPYSFAGRRWPTNDGRRL